MNTQITAPVRIPIENKYRNSVGSIYHESKKLANFQIVDLLSKQNLQVIVGVFQLAVFNNNDFVQKNSLLAIVQHYQKDKIQYEELDIFLKFEIFLNSNSGFHTMCMNLMKNGNKIHSAYGVIPNIVKELSQDEKKSLLDVVSQIKTIYICNDFKGYGLSLYLIEGVEKIERFKAELFQNENSQNEFSKAILTEKLNIQEVELIKSIVKRTFNPTSKL